MNLARILSRTQLGLSAPLVQVELHVGRGLPSFAIVGLPAPVVRESRERVRAALLNSGYEFPAGRITVNLAPVELSKQGGRFDLPIALGLLIASGQLAAAARAFECYGELGLAGELKPVSGLFLAALHAANAGHALIVPAANGAEVVMSGHGAAYGAASLREAAARLSGSGASAALRAAADRVATAPPMLPGLAEVAGQWQAKRALIIAAAGGHSLLMVGPPGSGKSMLAARLPGLLPPLSTPEALEVAGIASVCGLQLDPSRWTCRPFRAPHHTASAHAIVGGGPRILPGEISLAHQGVLFLDELPEFDRRVLESLREPLETGSITVARVGSRLALPAQFQLIAAMNPCACGYLGDSVQACRCTPGGIERYRQRISGPLLDRVDIRIEVPRVAIGDQVDALAAPQAQSQSPSASDPAAQVQAARERRLQASGALSARLSVSQLQACCALPRLSERLLRRGSQQLGLSGRGVHRLLALGRTIADLAGSELIEPPHLAEAMQLRRSLPGS
ncbi:MAG TPA: YifB family Mg chelatase-like AAA ATPase [Steroidobacteraceae bacterium]|jgi:magnesium chelatase family protein|nr:YifB family Mg chelatase-like AAA ATPase [Steroidobacteraceae bacterium]